MKPLVCTHPHVLGGLLLAWIFLLATSCASRKDVVYLQDATAAAVSQYTIPVPRIVKGDMLGITVNSKNRELSDPLTLPMDEYYTDYA